MLGAMKQEWSLSANSAIISAGPGWITTSQLLYAPFGITTGGGAQGSDINSSGESWVAGWADTGDSAGETMGLIIKYNADGTVAWQNQYNSCIFYDVVIDSSNNSYVAGIFAASPSTNVYYGIIVSLDSSGTENWQKMYAFSNVGTWFRATGIDIDPTQSYIYTIGYYGADTGFGTNTGPSITKFDIGGNVIWASTQNNGASIPSDIYGDPAGISVTPSGNIYVSGTHTDGTNQIPFLWKLSSSGTTYWKKSFSSNDATLSDVKALTTTGDNGVITAGINLSPVVMKVDPDANITWQSFVEDPSTGGNYNLSVAVDNNNNSYVSIYASTIDLYKFNPTGSTVWSRRMSGIAPIQPGYYDQQTLAINNTAKTILWASKAQSASNYSDPVFLANLDAYGTGLGTYYLSSNVSGNTYTYSSFTPNYSAGNVTFTTPSLTTVNTTSNITSLTGNATTASQTLMTLSNTQVYFGSR